MVYKIETSPAAERQLKKLPEEIRMPISESISALKNNPRPVGVKKMSGQPNLYRIRVGKYRILYTIFKQDSLIIITKVAHRRDVYQ